MSFTYKVPTGGSNPAGAGQIRPITMPIPWSQSFLKDFLSFIKALGGQYNGNPHLYAVQMVGAGGDGEMSLPMSVQPPDIWTSTAPPPNGAGNDPYTSSGLVAAWDSLIDGYRQAFPDTRTALDIDLLTHTALRIPASVTDDVVAHAETYGSMVMIQQNGLHAGDSTSRSGEAYGEILSAASSRTMVGWQAVQGGNSDASLMNMVQFAIASHASYLEIYPSDCTNPSDAAPLQYFVASGQ